MDKTSTITDFYTVDDEQSKFTGNMYQLEYPEEEVRPRCNATLKKQETPYKEEVKKPTNANPSWERNWNEKYQELIDLVPHIFIISNGQSLTHWKSFLNFAI